MKFNKIRSYVFILMLLALAGYFVLKTPYFLWGSLILLIAGIVFSIRGAHKSYKNIRCFNKLFRESCQLLSESSTSFYKIKNQAGILFDKVIRLEGILSGWIIMRDDDGVYRYKVLRGKGGENTGFRDPSEYFGVDEICDNAPLLIPAGTAGTISNRNFSFVYPLVEGKVINGFVGFSGERKKILKEYGSENFSALASLIKWMYKNAFKIRQMELQTKKTSKAADSAGEELSATNRRLINRVKELKSLYNLSVAVYDASTPEEAASIVFGEISDIMDLREGIYFEVFGDRLRAKAFSDDTLAEQLQGTEFEPDFIAGNRVVEITSLSAPEYAEEVFNAIQAQSLLAVPAKVADTVKGYFLLKVPDGRDYSSRDFELLEMYASRLAEFIERNEILETAIKNGGRLEKLNKLKDNFIALMSHELKTPLTSIKGFTDLLSSGQAGELTRQQKEFIQTIQKSAKDLEESINKIIETGDITRSRAKINKKPADFVEIVEKCLREYKKNFEEKNIDCKMELYNNIPRLKVDGEKIQQAIKSILDNAVKFTSAGGQVSVKINRKGDFIYFSVIDSGIGISEKLKKKIFEKFFQHQNPKTRDIGGLGLGLTLARSVIVAHGGEIHIDSPENGGAEVSFILPLK